MLLHGSFSVISDGTEDQVTLFFTHSTSSNFIVPSFEFSNEKEEQFVSSGFTCS
jgi:hypothetical protein